MSDDNIYDANLTDIQDTRSTNQQILDSIRETNPEFLERVGSPFSDNYCNYYTPKSRSNPNGKLVPRNTLTDEEIEAPLPVDGTVSPPPRRRKFRSRAESKLVAPSVWLIEGLIQEQSNVGIYAPSQFLKSFTAVSLAGALATGKLALGSFAVARSGPVFYAAGEGKANVEKKRVTAWEVANGIEAYGASELFIGDGLIANDKDAIMADITEIKELANGQPVLAIFIDTLALALNGADEDKSHVAACYFNFLNKLREETGASVTISVGHFGKDIDRGERGSSAFQASYDTILWIKEHAKDEASGMHTINLWVRKQKDGDDGQTYYFQSQSIETPDGAGMVLVPIDADEGREILDGKRAISVDDIHCALRELCRGGHISKRQLAKHLSERFKITVDGVEKALDRGLKKGTFTKFVDNGKWRLPFGGTADESFSDQIKSFRDEQTDKNRQDF